MTVSRRKTFPANTCGMNLSQFNFSIKVLSFSFDSTKVCNHFILHQSDSTISPNSVLRDALWVETSVIHRCEGIFVGRKRWVNTCLSLKVYRVIELWFEVDGCYCSGLCMCSLLFVPPIFYLKFYIKRRFCKGAIPLIALRYGGYETVTEAMRL